MLNLVKLMAATVLAACSVSVFAIPANSLTGNGVIWSLNVDSINSNTASFTLSADVSGSTLGDAYLHEFSLKNFASNASISNLSAPLGIWDWQNEGLSGTGCKNNATYDALCVYNIGNFREAPSTASDFMFTFDVSLDVGDLFPELMHFKVRWVEDAGYSSYAKVGDLISDDFSVAYTPVTDEIPEPATLGLLAIGLAGIAVFSKRQS